MPSTRARIRSLQRLGANPWPLLELARGLNPQKLAGGLGFRARLIYPAASKRTQPPRYRRSAESTRAAADAGEAAGRSGDDVAKPTRCSGLATKRRRQRSRRAWSSSGVRVRFRNPLLRARWLRVGVAAGAAGGTWCAGEVTDAQLVRIGRALAPGTCRQAGQDEAVGRGVGAVAGPGAGACGVERRRHSSSAPTMVEDWTPRRRTERARAAAAANLQAGAFDAVRQHVPLAEAGQRHRFAASSYWTLAARLAFVTNRGSDAPSLLAKDAKRLEHDRPRAFARYLQRHLRDATMLAGRLALGGGVLEVARRRRGRHRRSRHATRAPNSADGPLASALRGGI